ncbi:MAG: enoyl-CoA hydratase/isomerase family protein [Polyangiaceae bacterium]|nr:enoyl-CoA hydratase/isomerase family protein [Polyangiaceae bacterium]
MTTTYETLLVERDGAVARITINRPDKLNALSPLVIRELTLAVTSLRSAPDAVRALILTGAGDKAFVAGADIAAMQQMTAPEAYAFSEAGHRLGYELEMSPFPVLAAVNGFALGGGCELVLACDLAYAADHAKLGQPEVNLGVIPGFGGTQRLSRRVGPAKARELVFTGDVIGAEEARRIGLVNDVVPRAELLSRVTDVAKKIAAKGPLAIAAAKRVMHKGADLELSAAHELEAQAFGVLFGSEDQKEGMSAFLAKRAAAFRGK